MLCDIQVVKETLFLLAFVIVKLKSIADYCISLNKNDEMQLIGKKFGHPCFRGTSGGRQRMAWI